jgi:hypothetical protein
MSEWSRQDRASVERAGLELRARGWRKAFSLDEMLGAYEQIIGQVEKGYDDNIYEYTNDLGCRNWLALAWPLLTENVRQSRAADLGALDDRFRSATADDGGRSRFREVESIAPGWWWWRRVPVKVRGEFAADLAEEDLPALDSGSDIDSVAGRQLPAPRYGGKS